MIWIITLLFLASLLNLALTLIIWRRNYKSPMNIFYALANFGVFLWVVCQVGIFLAQSEQLFYFSWVASYISGAFIAANVAIFSFYFPFAKNISKKLFFIIYLLFFALLVFLLLPGTIIEPSSAGSFSSLNYKSPLFGSAVYSLYFVIIFYIAFRNLIGKYVSADGFAKSQIKLILMGASASLLISFISNIVAPIFVGSAVGYLGPLSSVVMAFFAAYLLYFKEN